MFNESLKQLYATSKSKKIARNLKFKVDVFNLKKLCNIFKISPPRDYLENGYHTCNRNDEPCDCKLSISDYLIVGKCKGVLLRDMGWHSIACPIVSFILNEPSTESNCELFLDCKNHSVPSVSVENDLATPDCEIYSNEDAYEVRNIAETIWFRHVCHVLNVEFPLKESRFGMHLKTCEWSDDSARCGPDTCYCKRSAEKYFVLKRCHGVKLRNGEWHHEKCFAVEMITGRRHLCLSDKTLEPFACRSKQCNELFDSSLVV